MQRLIRVARNLAAAGLLAFVGLGYGPAETAAQEQWECIHSENCTACSDGQCIYSCCGGCKQIEVVC